MFEKSEKEHRSSLKIHKVCNRTDAHKCSFVQTLQQATFSVYKTQKAAFIHREMITLSHTMTVP